MGTKTSFGFAPLPNFISYMTRINYGTVIAEMVADTGLSKTALSMALTGCFITYGVGQILSGFLGDAFQPKHMVATGLAVTTAMNLCIPLCHSPAVMTAFWCVNGLAQAFMWPPITKLLNATLSPGDYARGTVRVSWGSSIATIALYLFSPVMIVLAGWRSVFVLCAAILFCVGAAASLFLSLFYNRYATLNVVLSAVLTGCMHGVNYMLICILPPLLAKQGRVSTMSGLLNACTYIGSALATYAIPFAAEHAGWHASLILWLAVALGGMVLCFLCVPLWKTHKVES